MRLMSISALTRIVDDRDGNPRLDMARISYWRDFETFADLRRHVLVDLRFPRDTADKRHGFGWSPTLFLPGEREFTDGTRRHGHWRRGEFECETLSAFIADVDNADDTRPIVTPEEVAERLLAEFGPLSLFTYTSHSDRPEKRKFRVCTETDRDIAREEAGAMFVWLDRHVFGGQGDASIYDPADFLFAPPHRSEALERDGKPLAVDPLLWRVPNREKDPDLWSKFGPSQEERREVRAPTPEEAAAMRAKIAAIETRTGFGGIDDPRVFNPDWRPLYPAKAVNGSHWETMRSLLAKAWWKTGGDLTRGEMERLFDEIDGLDAFYFAFHYDRAKRDEVISWVMRLPPLGSPADHPGAPRRGAWAEARRRQRGG